MSWGLAFGIAICVVMVAGFFACLVWGTVDNTDYEGVGKFLCKDKGFDYKSYYVRSVSEDDKIASVEILCWYNDFTEDEGSVWRTKHYLINISKVMKQGVFG